MVKELTKDEFLVLLSIAVFGKTDLDKLRGTLKNSDKEWDALSELDREGLIKMEFRDGDVYGFVETSKGYAEVNNPDYKVWRSRFD